MLTDAQMGAIEAILFVASRAVPACEIAGVLGVDTGEVSDALTALQAEYAGRGGGRARGFTLRKVAQGWRLFTSEDFRGEVESFIVGGHPTRLSPAALETLAIVAYRQPVTRGQIAAVRGVNVDGVVRTLLGHDLIAEAGSTPTGAITYETTPTFLDKMGLRSLDDLPALAPYLPDEAELEALDAEASGQV